MKLAIPVWNDCVSNVFDFAHRLRLFEIDNDEVVARREVELKAQSVPQRAGRLSTLDVDVLVCGAISRPLACMITDLGIEVLAFVTGRVDEVLKAYMSGQLLRPEFTMPGCRPGARKGFRCVRRRHRWQGGGY